MEPWSRFNPLTTVSVFGYLSTLRSPEKAILTHGKSIDGLQKAIFERLPDGIEIAEYTLHNHRGVIAKVISYGASLHELWLPDRDGEFSDVVLGCGNLQGYLRKHPYFGATIGRYANRIAKGRFTLNGKEYELAINDPPNSLHGGLSGFDRQVWKDEPVDNAEGPSVRFIYVSKDGEESFPGKLTASVTYTLTHDNELKLDYTAATDQPTLLNLTNHSYFNLAGQGDILGHILHLSADEYTPVDKALIPTGELRSVAYSALDFRTPTAIGARIGELKEVGGYDHNFVVNGAAGTLRPAARLTDPKSGRQMEVWTTEPGIQVYSGIHLDGSVIGKGGIAYRKYGGLCLETQHFPDSPNHPNFPTTILLADAPFHSQTVYKFSTA